MRKLNEAGPGEDHDMVQKQEDDSLAVASTEASCFRDSMIRQPRAQPALSDQDLVLFDFYVNRLCPTCLLFDGQANGYRNMIPLSVQCTLLMTSVLAVAAKHLGFHDPSYHNVASRYKGQTLHSVRRVLAAESRAAIAISKPELLSTILMLCSVEISDQCQPGWLVHLRGANALIIDQPPATASHNTYSDSDSDSLMSEFIAPYFAAHNILAYTAVADRAWEPRLLDGGRHWLSRIKRCHREIDSGIGCSAELLSIILDITVQIRHLDRTPNANAETQAQAQARVWKINMQRRLRDLKQELPDVASGGTTSGSQAAGEKAARAFQQGAILLLQYLDKEDSRHESNIQDCVDNILELIKQCPVYEHGARSSAFWPFFLAGCHATREEDRVYVLERFRRLERPKRFGNIHPARELVEHVWKQKDLRADCLSLSLSPQRAHGRCFAWEDAMAQLGSTVSLT